ncbi:thioesterase [Streptomyces phaeolivaceus]|uniref:Thioesterase n=1 Tax=Streptomyces phaeolivaceus TaxID=2653200 RepID=A0A5P8KBE8_9ACTN|nr:alpha/beta fold hydrolase [Streptomyces phaeolivaceus]QFR00452.1 thioesterase [Streptomyces phaeolivaceus]
MSDRASRWLLRRKPGAEAAVRLYCFPHSGASPSEYMRWVDHLPGIEVLGVQGPGRGARIDEPPYDDMGTLVDAILDEVVFEAPFVFFGHSLGALTAYEAARALRDRGRPQPEVLFASAMGAPHLQPHTPPTHHLDDVRLLRTVEAFGPLPTEVLDDPELREIIVRLLRADARILDTYQHAPGLPLNLPVVALGGASDTETEFLRGWTEHTTYPLSTHVLPGDHFYLRGQREELLGIIRDTVRRRLDAPREPEQ